MKKKPRTETPDHTFDVQAFARGIHEVLVLGLLQDGPKHGYQIALDLAERSEGLFQLKHGTLYPILHRLETDGRIAGSWTEARRARKVYRLTAAGRRSLEGQRAQCEAVFGRLFQVLDGEDDDERAGKTVA
jgi:PadR family transcriptional regulator, regulatory protein PadR